MSGGKRKCSISDQQDVKLVSISSFPSFKSRRRWDVAKYFHACKRITLREQAVIEIDGLSVARVLNQDKKDFVDNVDEDLFL